MNRIKKLISQIQALQIPIYAANASFFLVLSVFPTLVLMLGLLRYTSLSAADLQEFAEGFLPEAFYALSWQLIQGAYAGASKAVISLSALTALWSAGRGIYGLIRGLDTVYGRPEDRGWLKTRLISAVYTFFFLLVLLLTLVLHVFGNTLLEFLEHWGFRFPINLTALRFFLLVTLQTLLFCAMFMVLPQGGNGFRESLPGALFASCGWMSASSAFSLYMEYFPKYASIFGSVYAAALAMLWLWFCVSIVFYGGVLNGILKKIR